MPEPDTPANKQPSPVTQWRPCKLSRAKHPGRLPEQTAREALLAKSEAVIADGFLARLVSRRTETRVMSDALDVALKHAKYFSNFPCEHGSPRTAKGTLGTWTPVGMPCDLEV